MRRLMNIVVTGVLAVLAVGGAGCGRDPAAEGAAARPSPTTERPTTERPAGDWPVGVKEAEVYTQVLRRYLGTGDNSFPGRVFQTVYVLDQAYPDAADPHGTHGPATPIASNTRHEVAAALADMGNVVFVPGREAVVETREGCGEVRDGGILITLGTVDGDDNRVQVALHGFVACLGATWLTYVVENQAGTGWRVTGTTGPMAIS